MKHGNLSTVLFAKRYGLGHEITHCEPNPNRMNVARRKGLDGASDILRYAGSAGPCPDLIGAAVATCTSTCTTRTTRPHQEPMVQ
jgi:hypothetical protein